ncbi:cuticle protein 10.9-like [Tropilaelaps mercedesae]|uniref:Cuticle protein 10.9-like n=1 Tax=Tropilaelaps mercedesae TaxID=418985 RepID=A0A1V9XRE5_9ACAR|nr:cuticle protein 10.9-like [Tropilaelaps mercedesae]
MVMIWTLVEVLKHVNEGCNFALYRVSHPPYQRRNEDSATVLRSSSANIGRSFSYAMSAIFCRHNSNKSRHVATMVAPIFAIQQILICSTASSPAKRVQFRPRFSETSAPPSDRRGTRVLHRHCVLRPPTTYSYISQDMNDAFTSEQSHDNSERLVGKQTIQLSDDRQRFVSYEADESDFHADVVTNELDTETNNPAVKSPILEGGAQIRGWTPSYEACRS